MKINTPRHAFHYAPFRHLFFARTLTVLGNSVAPVALAFAVLDMGGSAADLGVVVAARSLCKVLFLLSGGVLADRYSRNRVLLMASLVAALSQSCVAWLVLEQAATLASLTLLSAVNGAAAGIALPASSAMVPQTVPAQKLRQANAFIQSGVYAGTIIGASLGGMLTSTLGAGWGLAVDALGFALAAPLYYAVRTGAQAAASAATLWQDLRDGWREFTARSWVWAVVAQFAVVNAAFTGMVMVLGPVIADSTFGRARWGVMIAAQSVGLIIGSGIALRWRPRRAMFTGVMLVALCIFPMLLLAGGAPSGWLMVAFCIAGMGSFITIPLGELAAGPLAIRFGNQTVLLSCAAAVLAATLAACLVPGIRRLRQRE
ncbi:MFS transporter [Pantoea sp.]|uniref:MFS transporter n=1 Tax=Pantoea sp. TaxID=69393 RepID=UPI0028AC66C8|nr:MFS transporter [Pantoea sp.]